MAEELENDVTELGESVEEDGISGNLKDYTFEPGRIEEGADPENKGRIKVVTVSGSTPNEYWCYPWVMSNHAAYSEPVKGSDVWVFRNNRNSREGWYWLACTMHNLAQTYVDDNAGGGTDVISSRNHGSGSSSLTQSSGGGYTMSSPKASVNVGGGGSNASIKTSSGSGVSAKGEKTTVGNESKGSEPAVLGDKLTNLLTMFIQKVAEFIACLPVPGGAEGGGVVEAEQYCNEFYVQLSAELEQLGMGDILSDNVDISANENLKNKIDNLEQIDTQVDNMSEKEINEAAAKMFNELGFGKRKNWKASDVDSAFSESKSKEFIKEGLKEYNKRKKSASDGKLTTGDVEAFNRTFDRGKSINESWNKQTKGKDNESLGLTSYRNMSGAGLFKSNYETNRNNAYYEEDQKNREKYEKRQTENAKEAQELSRRNLAINRAITKYGIGKKLTSNQLESYVEKEYNNLVNEQKKQEKEKLEKQKFNVDNFKKTKIKPVSNIDYDTQTHMQSAQGEYDKIKFEPDWEIGINQYGQMVQRDKNGIVNRGEWMLSS